jgi:pre-mRNA-splicing factor SYF1
MPRLWLLYFTLLSHPLSPSSLSHTHARRTFDRALRTLPHALHLRVWKEYLRWAELRGGETCLRVWRRYLSVDPSLTERYVATLLRLRGESDADEEEEEEEESEEETQRKRARVVEAAKLLLRLARDAAEGKYTSPEGKSPYQLLVEWLELCEKYAEDVGMPAEEEETLAKKSATSSGKNGSKSNKSGDAASASSTAIRASDVDSLSAAPLPVGRILRELGIARFPDQAGRLWTGLATYWIKRGELDVARDVFEEGMRTVVTVRDFTQIFDAYAETSENVVSFLMEELSAEDDEEEEEGEREEKEKDLDAKMRDFEELMERRPFLVNDVLLRRNPDDVQEWEKRVVLHGEDEEKVVETYNEAIATINPRKATANLHQLLLNFAKFYEEGGSSSTPDLESARQVLRRATEIPYRRVDDLAEVWCEWAEMEVRAGNFDEALRVLARATQPPNSALERKNISYHDEQLSPQKRLFKSTKLHAFYVDLQESIGSVEGAKTAYDRILELKIANAQIIVNYASFLEENKYFEESFKVYERGVEAFTYPVVFELWNVYLSKFVKRYVSALFRYRVGAS